jgi:hypothetical protein
MPPINAVNEAYRAYMTISNASFHEYYGTFQRFTDNDYDKKSVFAQVGNGVGMAEFSSMEEGLMFITCYMELKHRYIDLKHLVNQLGEDGQQTNEPMSSVNRAILVEWVSVTNNFIHRYGMTMVPYDVRSSLHEVRLSVGLHALTWPIILLLNLDGTIALSDDFDHLGRVQSVYL